MNKKNPTIVPIKDDTDWDFVIKEGDPNLDFFMLKLKEAGIKYTASGVLREKPLAPVERSIFDLMFAATTPPSEYEGLSTIGVVKCFDDSINLIVKSKETYDKYVKVFDLMTPEFYRGYIWKSSPNKKGNVAEKIRERIELLVEFV